MSGHPRNARPAYTAKPGEAVRVFYNEADGSYAIGSGRMTVASADMAYVADVIRDLTQVVFTPAGHETLRKADALGRHVRIVKPEPPTEPPNAWTIPDDLTAATAGVGCGSTIAYNPADWPRPGNSGSPSSAEILVMMLRQANTNATGKSDPSSPTWGTDA